MTDSRSELERARDDLLEEMTWAMLALLRQGFGKGGPIYDNLIASAGAFATARRAGDR